MADSPQGKTKSKDMYWFAHGGEPLPDKSHQQKSDGDDEVGSPEQHNSPSWKPLQERKVLPEEARNAMNGKECTAAVVENSPLLSHTERDDRVTVAPDSYSNDARTSGDTLRASRNAENEKKKYSESDLDKNDAKARKKVEREATFEAKRNAQRSNVSFAFGSSLPRNLDLDVTTVYQGSDLDRSKRRGTQAPASSHKPEEGWAHMHSSVFATFENTQVEKAHRSWTPAVNQPLNCLVGSGAFVADDKMSQSMISPMSACRGRRKTDLTPTIPYDRTAPPRTPVPPASSGKRSVSMTRLDQLARPRRSYVEAQRDHAKANSTSSTSSVQKDIQNSPSRPRSSASEHSAGSNRPATTPPVNMRARTTARKPRPVSIAGTMPDRKVVAESKKDFTVHRTPEKKSEASATKRASTSSKAKSPAPKSVLNVEKPGQKTPIKHLTPKSSPIRKLPSKTKKSVTAAVSGTTIDPVTSSVEEIQKTSATPPESPTADEENGLSGHESSGKRIISEEEARAALAEKRRLAREQAEREAELERQRQEEIRLQEEERIRQEEEEQRKMEEEQLRLLEEHRRQEEEKLRKAIEEQERKEQEEKLKREEEARLKAEQERKAKEEAEKQRIELEEKLRKEEEERAERKKRLEKIMSRTRGKGASSSSSHSGGDHSDADSQEAAEALSGNSSLNSVQSTDPSSGGSSLEIHPESIQGSENESFNSMDMIALSENSSLDSNLLMLPSEGGISIDSDQASSSSNQNLSLEEKVTDGVKTDNVDISKDATDKLIGFGDNAASYSSDNESVTTDTTVLTKGRVEDHSIPPEMVDSLDSTSDKVLDFVADNVQTLVSQSESGGCTDGKDFPANDPKESSLDNMTQDIMEKTASLDLGYFTAETKEDSDTKSQFGTPIITDLGASEIQGSVECSDFGTNPFAAPAEMSDSEIAFSKPSEEQDTYESVTFPENDKVPNFSEKEIKVDGAELDAKEESVGNIEGGQLQNDQTSPLETSKLLEENLPPCPVLPKVDLNNINDENSAGKIFDGNSEQLIDSVKVSQSFGSRGGIFDGNSEQYFENANMSQSINLVFNPFSESKAVESSDGNVYSGVLDLVKMDDSVGVITSIEDLEPSAIHSVQNRINLSDEHFVSAVTDSEDSSLDSNLSQVMNVNITHNTIPEERGSLDVVCELSGKTSTQDFDEPHTPLQKGQQYVNNDHSHTTNGYQSHVTENFAYGNGVGGDYKTTSVAGDRHPVSSLIDNEINSNVISSINNHHVENILNTGDINFNKVPSNPFLAADDTSEVSENQFLNQEEIIRKPLQTEFHA